VILAMMREIIGKTIDLRI